MYLIAGLGNPDKKYDGTRHNIGFVALHAIASEYMINLNKLKHKAVFGEGMIQGKKVILSKPQTYMNNSGESIADMASFYKIESKNIIIMYDDVSLDTGRIRIRPKGSAGGHNGIKSIIYHLNSDVFTRIKIGVGSPSHPDYDLADYVLGRFTPDDMKILSGSIKDVVSSVECIIASGLETAMNNYNGK